VATGKNIGVEMKHIGLFLRKERIDQLSKRELINYFQMLRIINSLQYWLRIQVKINKDYDKLFDLRNSIELCFIRIGMFKESLKIFFRDIEPTIDEKYIHKEIKNKLDILKKRVENRKTDDFLRVVDYMRNDISFHFKDSIYSDSITEGGNTKEDLLFGYAVGETYDEFIFLEPYSIVLKYIADHLPENVDKKDVFNWIDKKSNDEISNFSKICERIVREMMKKSTYKKEIEID
jgi:hypothetical protein